MDHTLRHREGAVTDLDGLHGAEQGKEFVELHLRDAHVVEEILREGCRMLRYLDQPRQDGSGIDLEDPGDGADAQAFRPHAHRPHQLLGRDAFAMERRAVGLLERALASRAVELPPGATARMAVGTEIAQPHPAPIGTGGMRAEMLRGVHLARPSPRGDHAGWRATGRLGGVCVSLLTGGTGGLAGEARKRLRGAGALARWRQRLGWPLIDSGTLVWPGRMQHDAEPEESQEHHLVEKEV